MEFLVENNLNHTMFSQKTDSKAEAKSTADSPIKVKKKSTMKPEQLMRRDSKLEQTRQFNESKMSQDAVEIGLIKE